METSWSDWLWNSTYYQYYKHRINANGAQEIEWDQSQQSTNSNNATQVQPDAQQNVQPEYSRVGHQQELHPQGGTQYQVNSHAEYQQPTFQQPDHHQGGHQQGDYQNQYQSQVRYVVNLKLYG